MKTNPQSRLLIGLVERLPGIAVVAAVVLVAVTAGPGAFAGAAGTTGAGQVSAGVPSGSADSGVPGGTGANAAPGASAAPGAAIPGATPGANGAVPTVGPGGATASGGGAPGGTTQTGGGGTTGPGGGSGSGASANCASYQGITCNSILVGEAWQQQGCGGFSSSAVGTAYGVAPSDYNSMYNAAETWFNKFAPNELPIPASLKPYVNTKTGYYGRFVKGVRGDDGGLACPDVARALATTFAEQDHVFGMVEAGSQGTEDVMSKVMAQHRLIEVGRCCTYPSYYADRAPYVFDNYFGTADQSEAPAVASWVCRDWAGKPASNTGDPLINGMPRKYAIVYPDLGDGSIQQVSKIVQEYLTKCGVQAEEVTFAFDLAKAEANAQTVANRLQTDKVTTVLDFNDFYDNLFVSNAATNQGYFPEWIHSGLFFDDFADVIATFTNPAQQKNIYGAVEHQSPKTPGYADTEQYKVWNEINPGTAMPGDWPQMYYQWKFFALGVIGAGSNLTPATFNSGARALCAPCNTVDKHMQLYQGRYETLVDFDVARFNPTKPNPTAAPNSAGQQPNGYWDFLENGKRYFFDIYHPE